MSSKMIHRHCKFRPVPQLMTFLLFFLHAFSITYVYRKLRVLYYYDMLNLQIHPQSPSSPVLASLRMSVELWMSLWAGHWVVETVLISTSSTLPPTIPGPHMEDFWTSPLPMSHWLVSWQASSIVSQYVVSTVGVWRGIGVNPWKLNLKVYVSQSNIVIFMYV